MDNFRIDVDWLHGGIYEDTKPKFWKECHVLRYGSLPYLLDLTEIEDLVVKTLHTDDAAYNAIQYVLSNSSPRSLEIQWLEPEQTSFDRLWITTEQMQTLATSISNTKTLKSFIFNDKKMSYLENKQAIEILAKGINGSNLEFVGFVNLFEYYMDTLYSTLSTNTTLKQLYLKRSTGLGSTLGRFILGSNITSLHLVDIALNDDGISSIVDILDNSKTLETFELRNFELRTFFKNFTDICTGLQNNRSLTALSIGSKALMDEINSKKLFGALKDHPTIHSLTFQIPSDKLDLLTNDLLLSKNSTLISLSINKPMKNSYRGSGYQDLLVTSRSFRNFVEALAVNNNLQHLFLGSIGIIQDSLKNDDEQSVLVNAFKSNKTLQTLELTLSPHIHNLLTTHIVTEILEANTSLTKLIAKRIYVTDVPRFIGAIIQHKSLTSLDVSYMEFEESYNIYPLSDALIQSLIDNAKNLRELKLPESLIPLPRLLNRLKNNESLTSVELSIEAKRRPFFDFNFVADVFAVNKTLVEVNTTIKETLVMMPYLKRNRIYQIDAIILAYNIIRSEHSAMHLPNEIWLEIFRRVGMFQRAVDIVFNGKLNKPS